MASPLPSQYDPATTESRWQKFWAEHHFYQADPTSSKPPYSIVIPPPNVTGSLHMGHALGNTVQDVLIRYQRMHGFDCLWLPGTDHAGISTQVVVERELGRAALGLTQPLAQLSEAQKKAAGLEGGRQRKALGREAFLTRVWAWKEASGGHIIHQLKRLGCSCDWSRERFTLEPALSAAVVKTFVSLYREGLIYRGEYLVNWCPVSQSAISDLEVDKKEVKGSLWYLRYPVVGQPGRYVVVATTRPETMLGDTAVAVNPEDPRYQDLIGKMLLLPIQNREIPVIGDEAVDASFGTGCVKVTPAHDFNDFAMGQRHKLPFINIFNDDATVNSNGGSFVGQDRFEARKNIIQWFTEHDLLEQIEPYTHTVPHSERAGVPVEPYLTTQWYVRMDSLGAKALAFLATQEPKFVPDRWEKVYRDWLVDIRDWCISRQLWWGHQIPAWYIVDRPDLKPIVAESEAEAYRLAQAIGGPSVQLIRDPDVLDTWFSSGLWPFATMGWPHLESTDLQRYYPTSVLVTGFDIIFFWVARMTMLAGKLTGKMPFQEVYITGLIRDEKGQKMSKTKGNGIDPLELMDKYGTDAVRYTLISAIAGAGQDIRMDYNRKTGESQSIEAARNFANKLWNASRFVQLNLKSPPQPLVASDLELADRWILLRLNQTIQQVNDLMTHYELGAAVKLIYSFIWDDYCDWYIELAKPRFNTPTGPVAETILVQVLTDSLKLLHPWMPHITEEIWQAITQAQDTSISVQPYPTANPSWLDPATEAQFNLLKAVIRTIRNLKAEAGLPPSLPVPIYLIAPGGADHALLDQNKTYLQVVKLTEIHLLPANPQLTEKVFAGVAGNVEVLLPLTDLVDVDALKVKLERDLTKKSKEAEKLADRLNGSGYRDRAPAELVAQAEQELTALHQQLSLLKERLAAL